MVWFVLYFKYDGFFFIINYLQVKNKLNIFNFILEYLQSFLFKGEFKQFKMNVLFI